MLGKLIQPEINEIIASRNFIGLKELVSEWSAPEVADVIEDLEPEDKAIVFRLLPRALATDVFEYVDLETQEHLLHLLGQTEVADILNTMASDDRTFLLEELPGPI